MDFRETCVVLLLLQHTGVALEISAPSTHKATVGSPALIPCSYTVQKPPVNHKLFAAFWYLEGKQILSYDDEVRTTDPRYSLDIEKALNGRVDLSISNIALSDAGFYACSVVYSLVQKTKDITMYVTAPPQVTITDKSVVLNEQSVLRCSVTGFYPVDISIKWFRGREMLRDVTVDEPRRNSDGSYNVDSIVTITPTEEDREQIFTCRIQHESLKKPLQEDFQLLYRVYRDENVMPDYQSLFIAVVVIIIIIGVIVILGRILSAVLYWNHLSELKALSEDTAGEQIMPLMQNLASAATWPSQVIPPREMPAKFTISQSDTVTCFMRLLRFYPSDIKIIWTNEDKPIPSTKKRIQTDGEQTFDATSECSVPWEYFISGVRVTWEHQSLPSPQHRDLHVEDLPWPPHVGSINVPKLEDGIKANLTCEISGYFPDLLSVNLFIKEAGDVTAWPIEPSKMERTYSISHKEKEQKDHTYNYEASLSFTPLISADQGSEIICRVEHPSLESNIERSTGPLQIDPLPDLEIGDINVPELILGETATLTCRLYNYILGVHTVEWLEEGLERGEQRAVNDSRRLRTIDEQSEDERTSRANLTLTPVTGADDGITYICRVKTSNNQKTIEKRAERLHVKGTAEERTTEERRTEGDGHPLPVNESIHEEKQKTSAELETDLLGERDNQDCTPVPENGKDRVRLRDCLGKKRLKNVHHPPINHVMKRARLKERSPHDMEIKRSDSLRAANQISEEEDDETKPLNNTISD